MKKLSQKTEIRRYLEAGGKLTQMAALNFWGCFRLADVIWKIKKDYQNEFDDLSIPLIETKMIRTAPSKFSEKGKLVAEYSLIKLA